MSLNQILKEINKIVNDELDDPSIFLRMETKAEEVDGWDSLTHIQIIVAIEKHFGVRFTSSEIQSLESVGDACKLVKEKLDVKKG